MPGPLPPHLLVCTLLGACWDWPLTASRARAAPAGGAGARNRSQLFCKRYGQRRGAERVPCEGRGLQGRAVPRTLLVNAICCCMVAGGGRHTASGLLGLIECGPVLPAAPLHASRSRCKGGACTHFSHSDTLCQQSIGPIEPTQRLHPLRRAAHRASVAPAHLGTQPALVPVTCSACSPL